MNEFMNKLLVFPNIFLIISLLIMILSLYDTISKRYPHYRKHKYLSEYGIQITGIVICTDRKTINIQIIVNAMVDSSWGLIEVQYEIEGNTYTYTFDGVEEMFRVGDKIPLFIDPYNHKNASLQDGRLYRSSVTVGFIFSGIFLFCSIIFLFVKFIW